MIQEDLHVAVEKRKASPDQTKEMTNVEVAVGETNAPWSNLQLTCSPVQVDDSHSH